MLLNAGVCRDHFSCGSVNDLVAAPYWDAHQFASFVEVILEGCSRSMVCFEFPSSTGGHRKFEVVVLLAVGAVEAVIDVCALVAHCARL